MPSFSVEHTTSLSADETFQKVQQYLEKSEGLRKLDGDLQCSFDPGQHTGTVKGSKFECDVKVTGNNPTTVVLNISVGFLLSPFKGKIQETLKSKLTQVLG